MKDYSQKTYNAVAAANQNLLGVQLGAACIDAKIPVQVVAGWLKVTRQAVYFWFTGETSIAPAREKKVQQILRVLHVGLVNEVLPAKDLDTALAEIKTIRGAL